MDCPKPSKTQRCPDCTAKVEAATARYRGKGKRGPQTRLTVDLRDIRYAAESLGKAYSGFSAIEQLGAMGPRRRDELLAEPVAQAHLAWKFLGEVLIRAGFTMKTLRRPSEPPPVRPAPTAEQLGLALDDAR